MSQPLSNKANRGAPVWFFVIFAVFGLAMFCMFVPVAKLIDAQRWMPVPCVIDSSFVKHHPGSKGGTYSIEVAYSYTLNGKPYAGSRYEFLNGSSSGYSSKVKVVSRYPHGAKTTCYVNPRDPYDSVLVRGLTPDMWPTLIPLLFTAIGVWGITCSLRQRRQPAASKWQPAPLRHAADFHAIESGPRELKPALSPIGSLLGTAFAGVFWNGIVSVFIVILIRDWHGGSPNWFLALFLIPFVLVGLVLIVAVFKAFLALFNPRAHLKITPGAATPGRPLSLEWSFTGRAGALTNLTITLEGSEQATYQNGKNTSTATRVFSTIELVNTADRSAFAAGRAQAVLPPGAMHSLDTGHNKIVWQLRVRGKIPSWPDLSEDYPLVVLPLRKGAV